MYIYILYIYIIYIRVWTYTSKLMGHVTLVLRFSQDSSLWIAIPSSSKTS